MYWLRARFTLRSPEDLQLLSQLYGPETSGELTFTDARKKSTKIEWCVNPFARLQEVLAKKPLLPREKEGAITCRLCGPDTIRAVSQKPERLDRAQFDHPQKALLIQWADHIDEMVSTEMHRSKTGHDIGYIFEPPQDSLGDMKLLHTALRLTKHVTHSVPCAHGFLVSNTVSSYLTYVGLVNEGEEVSSALMFDKDDGFLSAFSGTKEAYLNERVERWRNDGCVHPVAAYLDQYEGNGVVAIAVKSEQNVGKKRLNDGVASQSGGDDEGPVKKKPKIVAEAMPPVCDRVYPTSTLLDMSRLRPGENDDAWFDIEEDYNSDGDDDDDRDEEEDSEGEEKDYQ